MKNIATLLLCVGMFLGCSTESITKVDAKELEKQKKEENLVKKQVRVEQDLFALVGCQVLKSVSITTKEKKKQAYLLKKKAKILGGNVLNNLNFSERFENPGETIFEMGDKEYSVSADVYRCST